MEDLHVFCNKLLSDLRDLSNELFAYNPGITSNKIPLPILAQSIANLMYNLAKLRIDILMEYKNENR